MSTMKWVKIGVALLILTVGIFLVSLWLEGRKPTQEAPQPAITITRAEGKVTLTDEDVKLIVARVKEKDSNIGMTALDKIIVQMKELPNERLVAFVIIIAVIVAGLTVASIFVAKYLLEIIRELARMVGNFTLLNYSPNYRVDMNGENGRQMLEEFSEELRGFRADLQQERRRR